MEKAILFSNVSELGWEILRYSPLVSYYYKLYHKDNIKFIIMTNKDRFDLYGEKADILVPLPEFLNQYKADCFRLIGFKNEEYIKLMKQFKKQFEKRFNIIEHVYPNISKRNFANKNQFPIKNMIFDWKPRVENCNVINDYLPNNKPLITIAPRYRSGFRRNWPNWNEFYDLIYDNKKLKKFNFVLCGKNPDYIPDNKNRFYDINKIELNDDISTIGLTIETIKKSILTIGSQSSIPNLSSLLGIKTLMFGHQKHLHQNIYNVKKTSICFIEDMKYNMKPQELINSMIKFLKI